MRRPRDLGADMTQREKKDEATARALSPKHIHRVDLESKGDWTPMTHWASVANM